MNIFKRLCALFTGMLAMLSVSGCEDEIDHYRGSNKTNATGNVTVTAFDVGKADALVVQTENTVTVIDTGCNGDGKAIEKFLTAQGIDTVNTLIITHFDKDHVGGAARIINRMKVETVYVPDYQTDSRDYIRMIEKASETQTPITKIPIRESVKWQSDDASFTLYAAKEVFYGNNEENDFSLCLYIGHGENTFLFAGDAEEARQNELMQLELGTVTFLKFPYHGNYLPTTETFLDAFQPKTAVICCSDKEFADPSTVDTLEKRGVDAYYTNKGTVTVISDGSGLTCAQAQETE